MVLLVSMFLGNRVQFDATSNLDIVETKVEAFHRLLVEVRESWRLTATSAESITEPVAHPVLACDQSCTLAVGRMYLGRQSLGCEGMVYVP